MKKVNDQLVFSPSDLIVYLESPFASWMDRCHVEHPDLYKPDDDDAAMRLLQKKGHEHEKRYLARLGEAGREVHEIANTSGAVEDTLQAMLNGRSIIYQGQLQSQNFAGRADFLIRVDGASNLGTHHYQVWDTKLALKAKPYFIIQLCCYAEMLANLQGRLPEHIGVVLGNGVEKQFRTEDYFYYYRELKNQFLEQQAVFDVRNQPMPGGNDEHGRWTSHAQRILSECDHLSHVANIKQSQIKKLETAGIKTMTDLAQTTARHIPKLAPHTFETLKQQAQLQLESAERERPSYAVLHPSSTVERRGFQLLPPESSLDVYFDMEGYPHVEGGLEYLFGVTYKDGGKMQFKDWWAHDRAQERKAFEEFIDWVYARWQRDSNMHIYHYADYEVTAMRRLMGRHGTRERELDALLRNEVFVNLYTVVRQGLRVGEPRYSIKNIEHLYQGRRLTGVATAIDSVIFYEKWLEEQDGDDWQNSAILKDIRDYNKDDCDSTARLADWLREVQQREQIAWVRPTIKGESETDAAHARNEASALARRLLDSLPVDPEQRALQELLAYCLEFHWREAKPVFWARFDRAQMSAEQLYEDGNCLANLERTSMAPVPVKKSTGYEYQFDADQDFKIDVGSDCFLADDLRVKVGVSRLDAEQGKIELKVGPGKPPPPDTLHLIPDEFVPADVIADSIIRTVTQWHSDRILPRAIEDFLLRRRPRIEGNTAGPILPPGDEPIRALVRTILKMQDSTLCIQGPPGCGKTYTAARVIVELLRAGSRVGVTSNSHKAICHLLNNVSSAAAAQSFSFRGTKIGKPEEYDVQSPMFEPSANAGKAIDGGYELIGGTAWAFSNERAVGAVDYLFVDEAGQVSIANLIGMAPSTRNIILMGDQMQLSQPIQGAHPGESGLSTLEFLLQDKQTIPEDFGVFLGVTHRMHPDVCKFISEAVYEGRLTNHSRTASRQIVVPPSHLGMLTQPSGVLFVPVEHEGNSQCSDEEVARIRELVDELLTLQLTDENGERPVKRSDIMVVAPYNMQVRRLTSALANIRVGTVDKFQGQEAPIVVVSMCASDANESSRGLEFLLNKNRLNVAISRAQCLAIVVGNPALARTRCTRVEQIELVNLFCKIAKRSAAQIRTQETAVH